MMPPSKLHTRGKFHKTIIASHNNSIGPMRTMICVAVIPPPSSLSHTVQHLLQLLLAREHIAVLITAQFEREIDIKAILLMYHGLNSKPSRDEKMHFIDELDLEQLFERIQREWANRSPSQSPRNPDQMQIQPQTRVDSIEVQTNPPVCDFPRQTPHRRLMVHIP